MSHPRANRGRPKTSPPSVPLSNKPRITRWLEGVPATYLALNAAIAVIVPLFAPEQFLPEPLAYLRQIPPIVVAIGFLITWTTRASLRENLPRLALIMCVSMLSWILLLVLFVRGPIGDEYFLVGFSRESWVELGEYAGWTDEAIIRDNGGSWGELHEVWGSSLTLVMLTYTTAYVTVLLGVVASLGGSTLVDRSRSVKPRQSRSKETKVEPAPATSATTTKTQ